MSGVDVSGVDVSGVDVSGVDVNVTSPKASRRGWSEESGVESDADAIRRRSTRSERAEVTQLGRDQISVDWDEVSRSRADSGLIRGRSDQAVPKVVSRLEVTAVEVTGVEGDWVEGDWVEVTGSR